MLKSFKKLSFKNEEANTLQDNVSQFLNQLNPVINSGVLIQGISVGTTAKKIEHKLGRRLQGFIVVDKNSDCRVWRSSNTELDLFITLTASASSTISIWVF